MARRDADEGRSSPSLPSCNTWRQTINEGDRCPECARRNLPDQFGPGSSTLQRIGDLLTCQNGHGPICRVWEHDKESEADGET